MTESFKYYKLLSKLFPTIAKTSAEIINLSAILNLPKGTEHFITDIHGEYEAFNHVLKNCSGVVKEKINFLFKDTISEKEKNQLATIIYYPEEKIELICENESNLTNWYILTINRIISVLRLVASKYTSSKIRKALPSEFSYIIHELLYEKEDNLNKYNYFNGIINSIVETGRGKQFLIAVASLIQRLVIDHLHIVGDIYDRGPAPHKIVDLLMNHHNVDIQWGNHDILWMGAASGQIACIANAIRICIRYGHTSILEDGYGINLFPLVTFALDVYKDDLCTQFIPKSTPNTKEKDLQVLAKMHKAISVIQFKIEENLIRHNAHFKMENRLLLDKINIKNGTINIDECIYTLKDSNFPTIDSNSPCTLTSEESELIKILQQNFINSEKLQKHAQFLYSKGSIFLLYNSNLLYHGCIPLDENGNFQPVRILGKEYTGKALLEMCDRLCREGYYNSKNTFANDFLWYMWCGEFSPLFGKNAMKTFERYFILENSTHKETYNNYYNFSDSEATAKMILKEFEVNTNTSHIINGHVPIKVTKGESPIKANGKILLIDGGFSKAYQSTTGIAGYTLIFNSYGMRLVSHTPFEETKDYVLDCLDLNSSNFIVETLNKRLTVADTNTGNSIKEQISDLNTLLNYYKSGILKEAF